MRRARGATLILAGLAAAALAAASAAGCARRAEKEEGGGAAGASAPVVVTVRARAVAERTFADVVKAPGQWRVSGEIDVTAPFAGWIDSLTALPGDRVTKGQVVCRLITRESQAAVRGAMLLGERASDAAARAEAERALALARRDRVRVPVAAPRSGTIVRVSAPPEGEIAESAEIFALVPSDGYAFEARVSAADASRVRAGQEATIDDTGHPATNGDAGRPVRRAAVARILPTAGEGDQTALVWLRPKPGGDAPDIGRFGTATITVGAPRKALAVPDSAVVQDDLTGRTSVAVIGADGRAIWTPVTLGLAAAGWHELKAPALPAGALVVTEGQRGLPDSTRVKQAP